MSEITEEQMKVNYVISNTCYERRRRYPYRKLITVFKKPARRIEQGIFQMIVQMAYEMEASDIAERFIQSIESDFMMFKTMKTRKHKIDNYETHRGITGANYEVYGEMKGATNVYDRIRIEHQFQVKLVNIKYEDGQPISVSPFYEKVYMRVPLGYNKDYKGSVVLGLYCKYGLSDYHTVSDFQQIASELRNKLYDFRLQWMFYMFNVAHPRDDRYPDYRQPTKYLRFNTSNLSIDII